MQYKIVYQCDEEMLEVIVNSLLEEGWQLQGGVSIAVTHLNNNPYFAQALIKEEKWHKLLLIWVL